MAIPHFSSCNHWWHFYDGFAQANLLLFPSQQNQKRPTLNVPKRKCKTSTRAHFTVQSRGKGQTGNSSPRPNPRCKTNVTIWWEESSNSCTKSAVRKFLSTYALLHFPTTWASKIMPHATIYLLSIHTAQTQYSESLTKNKNKNQILSHDLTPIYY